MDQAINERLLPLKRTAIDGRSWWCVYDNKKKDWSRCFGKYMTKKEAIYAIYRARFLFANAFIDKAIDMSREGNTMYAISDGLDFTTVEYEKNLLYRLKNGWNILGIFHNGARYDLYTIENNKSKIKDLSRIIKIVLGVLPDNGISAKISMQTFYDRDHNICGLNIDIVFFDKNANPISQYKLLDKEAEKFKALFEYNVFIEQSKRNLIIKLEKDFGE